MMRKILCKTCSGRGLAPIPSTATHVARGMQVCKDCNGSGEQKIYIEEDDERG